jgi:hypothetical protein
MTVEDQIDNSAQNVLYSFERAHFFELNCSENLILIFVPKVDILELLAQQGEDHWLPWQQKRPLLHIACERGAWNCVKYLVSERSDEINQVIIFLISIHSLYH